MAQAARPRLDEACPICHRVVREGEPSEWVPVCPLVYPEIQGLLCHERCLGRERERTRLLRRTDLRPGFTRRRAVDR
jgi:hypothetical protein